MSGWQLVVWGEFGGWINKQVSQAKIKASKGRVASCVGQEPRASPEESEGSGS